MAAITDPRAIKFSNEKTRVLADMMTQLYYTAKSYMADWPNVSALFPNDTSILQDSAAPDGVDAVGGDGRPIVKGSNVNDVANRAFALISYFERGTLDGTGTASNAVLNTVLAVKVNGQAKF